MSLFKENCMTGRVYAYVCIGLYDNRKTYVYLNNSLQNYFNKGSWLS